MKECIACNVDKDDDSFYTVQKRGKPYTMKTCKACHQKLCKNWYGRNKESCNNRAIAWAKAHPARTSAFASKYAKVYYFRCTSSIAERAIKLFSRMSDERRFRFANAILEAASTKRKWAQACHHYKLDEELANYSGV